MTPRDEAVVAAALPPGVIVWLTGLSGAGKTTLATGLAAALDRSPRRACVLDGDELRRGLNSDLGFSSADRVESMRRAAEVARLMAGEGFIAIVALISPFQAEREKARALAMASGIPFIEVYLECPLATCEQRDPKGLYRRARAGAVPEFTGIDSVYEPPIRPDIVLRTGHESPRESLARLVALIRAPLGLGDV